MDPAAVVGLVAACSSLVKTCGSVVISLHNIAQIYKDAELTILSMVEQCENIRLAWTGLEEWAGKHLHDMDNSALLLERLQRSIYSGQLTMAQLEKDLNKSKLKTGTFRRRINVTWNATVFSEHQSRLRDQSASLQLLLQVISLPRNEERIEMMSIQEPVFRKADDSVLSIIPSRLSSRLSSGRFLAESDSASFISKTSVKSRLSVELRYIPFSFDNDLFTSYVYKRNYRLPSVNSRSQSIPRTSGQPHAPMEPPMKTIEERLEGSLPTPIQPPWFMPLLIPPSEKDKIVDETQVDPARARAAFRHLAANEFDEALQCVRDGFDVILCFLPESKVIEKVIAFFWSLWIRDNQFFYVIMQRMAYSTGEKWIHELRTHFLKRGPQNRHIPDPEWSSLEAAGRLYDQSRRLAPTISSIPSALQLACAAKNHPVSAYLLSSSAAPLDDVAADYKHPLLPAKVNTNTNTSDIKMVSLLSDHLGIVNYDDLLTTALISLFSCHDELIIWFDAVGPRRLYLDEAIALFIRNGANPKAMVLYLGKEVPLVHAVICTLHINTSCTERHWTAFRDLIMQNSDRDRIGDVVWSDDCISPLALAMVLGEGSIVKILLRFGAKTFWWGPVDQFHFEKVIGLNAGAVVDFLSTWCLPPLNSGDKTRLKLAGAALLPEEDGEALHLTTSRSYQTWQRARISFAERKALYIPPFAMYPKVKCTRSASTPVSNDITKLLRKLQLTTEAGVPSLKVEEDYVSMELLIHTNQDDTNLAMLVRNRNFVDAYECAQQGVDLATIFHRRFSIPRHILVDFFCFIAVRDLQLCKVALARIAYVTDNTYIELLASFRPRLEIISPGILPSKKPPLDKFFNEDLTRSLRLEPFIAERLADAARQSSTTPSFPTTMEMACAANDYQVVQYLLHCGHQSQGFTGPLIIASLTYSVPIVDLLLSHGCFKDETTKALEALIRSFFPTSHWIPAAKTLHPSWTPASLPIFEITKSLIRAGADMSIDMLQYAIEDDDWGKTSLGLSVREDMRNLLRSSVKMRRTTPIKPRSISTM